MKSNALIKDCVDNINFKNSLIFVNGKKHDENYRLKDKDICTIRQFPSNEDVGNGFLQAGGWILDPIGSVVTGAVTGEWGGTYYGIKVLNERMNSLKDSLDNSGSSVTDTDSIPTISGCKNQSSLGKVVPIILGKTKYTPCYIGMPYHSIAGADGETEYFTGLYQLGYNDLKVQDVKLGIYDLSSNVEDVRNGKLKINTDSIYNNNDYGTELEIKQDGTEVSLYSQKVIEEDRNVELAIVEEKSLNVPCFSAKYPHKVEIEIQFQGLVKYNDKNEAEDTNVEIEIKMSRDGGETYEPFANFTNTNTDGLVKTDNISDYVTKFTGKKDKVLRYVASRTFSWSDVKDIKNNRIEFVVCRKTKPESETNERSQVYLTRIRTWCYDRKESVAQNKLVIQSPQKEKLRKKTARLGFRIRTGKNEIYNVLDELNCTLTSKAKIWDSSTKEWSKQTYPTNNIASVILMLMQSFRGNKSFPDSKIDFKSFGKFYEFCERKGLKCNGALAKETKTYDAINNLLSIGRGLLVLNGSRYGIAIDDFQENPVMVLNSQNILSLNYSKAFNEEIHGYEATFINALNDYQEDTMIVTDSEHTSTDDNLILEKINITYISDPEQLHKHLLYLLACRKLRNENWNAKLSVDGYLIEIGNLVSIQEESLLVGIGNGGEIKNLVIDGDYITGIHVDNVFDTTDTSKVYGISVNITLPENYDGNSSIATYKLKNLNVKSNYLEFATPLHLDNELLPSVGDVISFGIYHKIIADGICQSKKENNDGTFNFEFIPYQEGVYNSDTGVIPDFISNVTSVKEKASVIPETKVTLEELNKRLETVNQTIEDALADIGVDTRIGDITSADAILEEHQIQIKLNIDYDNFIGNIKDFIYELSMDNGVTFNEIKRVNSDIYNYPLPSIHRYKEKDYFANWKLRVKAQSQYDTYSENWFEFDIDTSNYGTWIPPKFDYDQVIAIANEQGINVNLNNKFPSDVKLYGSYNTIVEFSRDGEEWIEVKDNYIPFDRSIDGYPEKEQVEQYKIRVHRKSYLVDHPLMYTEKYVDATGYGTWIPPVFAVNQIDAVAMEQGISVSLDNRLPNNTKYYGSYSTIIEYTRDGVSWNVADGEFIYFDRTVDGYPEKSQLENYKVRVTRKSLVIDHELIYTEQYIDTSSYRTWLPLVPTLRTSISGRTININIEQSVRNDGLRPYGVIKYKVQVKRITPEEDDKYSCPSLSLNPYDSEDNYKDVNSAKDYVLVDNNHRQTMPLSGQNATEPLPVDTMYRFKITAINLVTNVEAEPLETPNLTALATSVKDIVAGAITTTKLADNCVTVDKIAVDTLVANESFMNELTSNVVNAGKLTFEVMNVKDFGYIVGNDEPITYKYTKDNGTEGTFTPNKGELFFGDGEPADSNVAMADRDGNCIQLRTQSNNGIVPERKLYISAEDIASRDNTCKYLHILSSDDNATSANQVNNIYVYLFNKDVNDGGTTNIFVRRNFISTNSPLTDITTEEFRLLPRIPGATHIAYDDYIRFISPETEENDATFRVGNKTKVDIKGNTTLTGTLTVDNTTQLFKGLSVTNKTLLNGDLDVSGATKINNTLSVKNNIQISNTTDTSLTSWGTEPLSIGSQTGANIGISNDEIQARRNTSASILYLNLDGGNVEISKSGYNTDINSNLNVDGEATLNKSLSITNNATVGLDLNVKGSSILKALVVSNGAHVDGTFSTSNETKLGGTLSVAGTTTMTGALTANGGISTSGTLNATGILKIPYTRPATSVISANPNGLTWIE